MRLIFLLLLSIISLFARDNPFFPSNLNEKQTPSTNRVEKLQPFTTQQISLPNSARAVKAIVVRYQNLDGSISNEEISLNNAIDWHEPFIVSQKQNPQTVLKKGQKKATSVGYKFITFTAIDKEMKIHTKDKMIRNFMLSTPSRIVMDFARDTSFRPKNFTLNKAPYKKIRMGNHDQYYRVVIELDGQYKYKLQTNAKEHILVCY